MDMAYYINQSPIKESVADLKLGRLQMKLIQAFTGFHVHITFQLVWINIKEFTFWII